jgi:hypothetical protein
MFTDQNAPILADLSITRIVMVTSGLDRDVFTHHIQTTSQITQAYFKCHHWLQLASL